MNPPTCQTCQTCRLPCPECSERNPCATKAAAAMRAFIEERGKEQAAARNRATRAQAAAMIGKPRRTK
jgi:hypothetical protein